MNKKISVFLKSYSSDINKIDRLFVSAFVKVNKINVQRNKLIKQYLISETDREHKFLLIFLKLQPIFSIEKLLDYFEFVISPKDKIVNGAVYTPNYIREFIIDNLFIDNEDHRNLKICDLACGCSGFLYTISKKLKAITKGKYKEIFSKNIFGLDIQYYSIFRSKLLLSLLAICEGEDEYEFDFNLFEGNALDFNWSSKVSKFKGFDKIVGNPPYVCSRNIEPETFELLDKWEVTKSGHPDLYIPFFQIGLENLVENGTLGYITVNTFFKSINGRALREYFSKNRFAFQIIDFRDEQIFKQKNTYTCICLITKSKAEYIEFCKSSSSLLTNIAQKDFSKNRYDNLDDLSGWNLGTSVLISTINKIEKFNDKIFPKFSFSTGIATLKNSIYKFKPLRSDNIYYYFESGKIKYQIEKKICREIINSNKITTEEEIKNLKEKIIFPYIWDAKLSKYLSIEEINLKNDFPKTYKYLVDHQPQLSNRDKGQGDYNNWYEYGRAQGLNVKGIKLFLPHITNNPLFVLCKDEKLMFCNGEAIVSNDEKELKILKKILESKIFWFYIIKTSKPYASGYFSLGKNYLKNFSIPQLTSEEKKYLLATTRKDLILEFLLKKYDINKKEIKI